jgi:hypothetical protein
LLEIFIGLPESYKNFSRCFKQRLSLGVTNLAHIFTGVIYDLRQHLFQSGSVVARIGFAVLHAISHANPPDDGAMRGYPSADAFAGIFRFKAEI